MPSRHQAVLLTALFATTATLVNGQIQTIPAPNNDVGWCYYCSDNNAPPLCNAQCTTAINTLCNSGHLDESLQVDEKDCHIEYMPPVWNMGQNGARPIVPDPQICVNKFNGILNSCGKDASVETPNPVNVNQSYCTTSGGGGTWGWNDDGEVMNDQDGRYIIHTTGTKQCGQSKAPWHQATSVIQWNDSWVQPGDQVVLDTNPAPVSICPSASTGAPTKRDGIAARADEDCIPTDIPAPNPECDYNDCDIFDNPYFANSTTAPWAEGGKDMMRHRIVYEGWSTDSGSTRLFNSIKDRCGQYPNNFQAYNNPDGGPQRIADFNLPTKECWCIPDAIYDASAGITMPRNSFCGPTALTDAQGNSEFVSIP